MPGALRRFRAAFAGALSSDRLGAPPAEALATGLGLSSTLGILAIVPLLIGAYVESSALSLRQAGLLITIEVAASAVTMLGIAASMRSIRRTRSARLGAILAGVSYLAGGFGASFPLLCACRVLSGCGIGLIGAAVNGSVARAPSPERLYSTGLLTYGAVATVALTVVPIAFKNFGYWVLFVYIGLSFLLTAATSYGLNDSRVTPEATNAVGRSKLAPLLARPSIASLILGGPLLWIAFSMIWMFAERKAAAIGMSPDARGLVLAATNVIGMAGSLIANRVGLRIGRSIPLSLGGLTLAGSYYVVGAATAPQIYTTAMIVYGVAYYFILPYIVRLAADLDREGRVSIVYSTAPWVAHLVSPLLGAIVITQLSYHAMGILSAVISLTGTVLLLVSSGTVAAVAPQRSRRRSEHEP